MNTQRKTELDLIRVIAITCVVLNHAIDRVFHLSEVGRGNVLEMPCLLQILSFAGFTIGRTGVPLFLFLSGFLLLSREYDEKNIPQFYKHHLLPLIFTWEVWILLYNLFLSWFRHESFDFIKYLSKAFLISNVGVFNEWYMPMIFGMYLFIPFVSIVLHKISNKWILFLLSVVYIHFFILRYGCILLGILTGISSAPLMNLSFSGGVYGLYLIIGCLISENISSIMTFLHKKQWISMLLFGTAVIMIMLTSGIHQIAQRKSVVFNVAYDFPTIPILSLCVFLLLMTIHFDTERIRLRYILFVLSRSSFGVFLLHPPIQLVIDRMLNMSDLHPGVKIIFLLAGGLIFPFLIVCLSGRSKYLKKLFLIS